jgi:hypothetical protein
MDDLSSVRQDFLVRLQSELAIKWPALWPGIAVYIIGSAAKPDAFAPKDLDLLFVNLSNEAPCHEKEFRTLVASLQHGDPFAGAFGTSDSAFRDAFHEIVRVVGAASPAFHVAVSFAFGPVRGEIAIPEDTLHVHVSGPLSRGDLASLATILPFHAVSFRQCNRTLAGPPLPTLIPDRMPSLDDLAFWDVLLVRRIFNAPSEKVRRKWLGRMIANRRNIPAYANGHSVLLDRCENLLATATAGQIDAMVQELLNTPAGVESVGPIAPA